MEEKLKEIFDHYWKGIMAYDGLMESDKERIKYEYTPNQFYKALKAAYNAGIEVAADTFEEINYPPQGLEANWVECSKQDLLDLMLPE